jgi:amino acid transporter
MNAVDPLIEASELEDGLFVSAGGSASRWPTAEVGRIRHEKGLPPRPTFPPANRSVILPWKRRGVVLIAAMILLFVAPGAFGAYEQLSAGATSLVFQIVFWLILGLLVVLFHDRLLAPKYKFNYKQ